MSRIIATIVVAAAVVFSPGTPLEGVADSKLLRAPGREQGPEGQGRVLGDAG